MNLGINSAGRQREATLVGYIYGYMGTYVVIVTHDGEKQTCIPSRLHTTLGSDCHVPP